MWHFKPDILKRLLNEPLTVEEIAKKTGYSRQTVYGWLNGSFAPSIPAILKICNALGLNPASFFEYKGIKEPKNPPLEGKGEPKALDENTQYFFTANGNLFSITPLKDNFLRLCTYKECDDVIGYKVKERIKIRL